MPNEQTVSSENAVDDKEFSTLSRMTTNSFIADTVEEAIISEEIPTVRRNRGKKPKLRRG